VGYRATNAVFSLDTMAADNLKPNRPTITYTGTPGYPINRLTFQSCSQQNSNSLLGRVLIKRPADDVRSVPNRGARERRWGGPSGDHYRTELLGIAPERRRSITLNGAV